MTDIASETGTPAGGWLTLTSASGRIALFAAVAASAMTQLDASIVYVALPDIADDLGVDVTGLQWVLTGYLLTLASLILLGGALGDRYGRRRIFGIGTAWFMLASALCGLAPNLLILVLARMLQGVGGALLTPGSLALIQASFRKDDRAPAVGLWSGFGGVAGAIGPFLGGWMVDGPGWRWAFLLNVPLGIAVIAAQRTFPESRDTHLVPGFDIIGASVVGLGLVGMTWALNEAGERGWSDPVVLVPLLVGVAALLAFPFIELRSPHPLVPPTLFRSRTFSVLNISTFVLYGALGVVFFFVVYQLQVVAGWSAIQAGSALLPATILMLVGSASSGRISTRIGPKLQLVVGPLLVAAGVLLLSRIDADATWWTVLPGGLVFGMGLVTFVAPLTATVMSSADPDHVNTASGVNNAVARTGSLAAVAAVPLAAGLVAAQSNIEISDAYRSGMLITAILAVIAALIDLIGLPGNVRPARTSRPVHCALDGAPLQADPNRCPPVGVG